MTKIENSSDYSIVAVMTSYKITGLAKLPNFEEFDKYSANIYVIVEPDATKRKIVHKYLNENHPNIKHISLHSHKFKSIVHARFAECDQCNNKRVKLTHYVGPYWFGSLYYEPYWEGICPKCKCKLTNEDYIVYKHNIMILGNYVKNHNKPHYVSQKDLSKKILWSQVIEIIERANIYRIPCPSVQLKNDKLIKYINRAISIRPIYSIHERRKLIGTSSDMAVHAAKILEVPGGRRDLVRRALAIGFKTDAETYANLCGNPNDGLYIEELNKLCELVDIPIMKGITKSEIIEKLRCYMYEASSYDNKPVIVSIEEGEEILSDLLSGAQTPWYYHY